MKVSDNLLLEKDVEMGEVYCCRICYDEFEDRDEVIAPCLCSGSGKYICNECLQDWRANGSSSKSFTHCPTCEFEYHLENPSGPDAFDKGSLCGVVPASWLGRRSYFRYLVFSDVFTGFAVINIYLVGFAIFLRFLDYNERLVDIMPWDSLQDHVEDHRVIVGFKHHKATYFSASMFVNFLLTFVVGIWNYACRCHTSIKKIREKVAFESQKMSICSVLMCVAIFVLLKVFVGAFIALLSLVVWMQKAAARHMHVLVKKEIANDFRVVDLELTGRLKPKHNAAKDSWDVSAPPSSHFIASADLMKRLLNVKIHVD